MAKYTQAYLKKLEDLLKDNGYEIRYEKGNFKSGFCILEDKKVAVINKFSSMESRIHALVEIVNMLVQQGKIDQDHKQLFIKKADESADASAANAEEIKEIK